MTTAESGVSCKSDDEDTGLRCMKDAGHDGLHLVEVQWSDSDEPMADEQARLQRELVEFLELLRLTALGYLTKQL